MSDRGESPRVLALNGGSSSVRFAVYDAGAPHERKLAGKIDRIGTAHATLIVHTVAGGDPAPRRLPGHNHRAATSSLLDWLETQSIFASVRAVGHRVVNGFEHSKPQRITPQLLAELRRNMPFAPDHLPRELALIETVGRRHPRLTQVACFDTAFHRTMPRVAKLLPIPRRQLRRVHSHR